MLLNGAFSDMELLKIHILGFLRKFIILEVFIQGTLLKKAVSCVNFWKENLDVDKYHQTIYHFLFLR